MAASDVRDERPGTAIFPGAPHVEPPHSSSAQLVPSVAENGARRYWDDANSAAEDVQATVEGDNAYIAYELGSAWWGRGYASEAVAAMLDELRTAYRVRRFSAVAKRANARSHALLERAGFARTTAARHAECAVPDDEVLYERSAAPATA